VSCVIYRATIDVHGPGGGYDRILGVIPYIDDIIDFLHPDESLPILE
jgi:hypothetical protein